MQFRAIVVTEPQTHKHSHKPTDRTDYDTLRRSVMKKSAQKDANTALALLRRSQKISPRRRSPSRGHGKATI